MIPLIAITIGFGFVLFLGEYLYKKYNFSAEITRKIAHILGAGLAACAAYTLEYLWLLVFGAIWIFIAGIFQFTNVFRSLTDVQRKTYGVFLFPIGIFICVLFLGNQAGSYLYTCIAILGISDGISGLIDMNAQKKTWKASFVFFILTGLIYAVTTQTYNWVGIISIIIISALLTIIERYSTKGWDNITVPVSAFLIPLILSIMMIGIFSEHQH